MRSVKMLLLGLPILVLAVSPAFATPKVYVVLSCDTEVDQTHSGWYQGNPPLRTYEHPTVFLDTYSRTSGPVKDVMASSFRNSHKDSYNNPFKITWFFEMDKFYHESRYVGGAPFTYTGTFSALENNWSSERAQWHDEYAYHHHFMEWNGSDYWDQVTSSINYDYHYDAINYSLLEKGFMPATYRGGWVWEDNYLSKNLLEQYIPFDYTNDNNFSYWSGAPSSWVPYHPNRYNYKQTGNMDRLIVRCLSNPDDFTQANVNSALAEAESINGAVIFSYSFHNRDDMAGIIDDVHSKLQNASSNYGIPFEYTSSTDAVQSVQGWTDRTAPGLTIYKQGSYFYLESTESLWDDRAYIAYETTSGAYKRKGTTYLGSNTWRFYIPSYEGPVKIAAGASDAYGNTNVVWWTQGTGGIENIPEPASLSLILVSLTGIAAGAFRRLRAR